MIQNDKYEPVFDLIKCMSKAEKRNFKLYATRLAVNQQAKFLSLFDYLDSVDEYEEAKILQRCPIKKEQLPNMKAHLYKQILVSIRLLNVQHDTQMQLREQVDFARILYDKGLYKQSRKTLEKVKDQALRMQQQTIALDIIGLQKQLDTLDVTPDMTSAADSMTVQVEHICSSILTVNELANTSMRLYSLYQKLGYARTQKDLDLIIQYFEPRLNAYHGRQMEFLEKFYYYQAQAWYYNIQHDFVRCYRYGCLWVELFDSNPPMKELMYDNYLKGYSRILEGLYMMRKHRHFSENLARLEHECSSLKNLNDNARILSMQIIYSNKLHQCFLEGSFERGLLLVREIDEFVKQYSKHINIHHKMLIYYKVACLYFGNGDYTKCMEYLARIMGTKDHQIRRDLQCYAKILNLIASYEAGIDYNLDYQIRSVYAFLVKMNDMQQVQKEMLSFLKKLNTFYSQDLRSELKVLYNRLKPYENHPYERRTFYYLDIITWLESKITGRTIHEIIRDKYISEGGV